jgi:hypothetical protein
MIDNFKGMWIPKEIFLHPNLNATEKFLMSLIHNFSKNKNYCKMSNETIGKIIGLSGGRVKNMLSDLRKHNFIFTTYDNNGLRCLSVNESSLNVEFDVEHEFVPENIEHKYVTQEHEYVPIEHEYVLPQHEYVLPEHESVHIYNNNNNNINNIKDIKERKEKQITDLPFYFQFVEIMDFYYSITNTKPRIPTAYDKFVKYQPYKSISLALKDNPDVSMEEVKNMLTFKSQMLSDPKMKEHYVIETLFRNSNFNKYLQQTTTAQNQYSNNFKQLSYEQRTRSTIEQLKQQIRDDEQRNQKKYF